MKKNPLNKDMTPATTEDLADLKADLKADIDVLKEDIHALRAEMATKTDIAGLRADVESFKDEIKRYFDVMVETMKHEFRDAYHDGYATLRDRVDRLERAVGISV